MTHPVALRGCCRPARAPLAIVRMTRAGRRPGRPSIRLRLRRRSAADGLRRRRARRRQPVDAGKARAVERMIARARAGCWPAPRSRARARPWRRRPGSPTDRTRNCSLTDRWCRWPGPRQIDEPIWGDRRRRRVEPAIDRPIRVNGRRRHHVTAVASNIEARTNTARARLDRTVCEEPEMVTPRS